MWTFKFIYTHTPYSYVYITEIDEPFPKLAVDITYDQEGTMAFYSHSETFCRA